MALIVFDEVFFASYDYSSSLYWICYQDWYQINYL